MDKDRVEGTNKQVKGSIKEAIGMLTGNDALRAECADEKGEGDARAGAGKAEDAVRSASKSKR